MGGVGRVGEAGGPAAGADPGLIEEKEQGFGFDSVERDVRRVREAQRGMAVEFGLRDRGENSTLQRIAQRAHFAVEGWRFLSGDVCRHSSTGDQRDAFGSAPPSAFLMAALDEWSERGLASHEQSTNTLRRSDLVSGE